MGDARGKRRVDWDDPASGLTWKVLMRSGGPDLLGAMERATGDALEAVHALEARYGAIVETKKGQVVGVRQGNPEQLGRCAGAEVPIYLELVGRATAIGLWGVSIKPHDIDDPVDDAYMAHTRAIYGDPDFVIDAKIYPASVYGAFYNLEDAEEALRDLLRAGTEVEVFGGGTEPARAVVDGSRILRHSTKELLRLGTDIRA